MSLTTSYGVFSSQLYLNDTIHTVLNDGSLNVIACSGNGKYVVKFKKNEKKVFISSDYGNTYNSGVTVTNDNAVTGGSAISISYDGKYIVAGVSSSDTTKYIWISSDYGMTWRLPTFTNSLPSTSKKSVTTIAQSRNGQYVFFIAWGELFRSTDYGNTFTYTGKSTYGNNVTISSSGKYIATSRKTTGGGSSPRIITISTNYGINEPSYIDISNITLKMNAIDCSGEFTSLRFSGNGKLLYLTVRPTEPTGKGGICVSKDFGETWTKIHAGNDRWSYIVCSENGQFITAIQETIQPNDGIYYSKNFGGSWKKLNHDINITQIDSFSQIDCTSSSQYVIITLNNTCIYVANNYTYSYTPIKLAYNNTFNFTFTCSLYDCSGTYFLRNEKNETLSTKVIDVSYTETITFTDISTNSFDYGMSNLFVYKENNNLADASGYDIQISDPMVINATCFLEGTKILAMDKKRIIKYIPIEKLKPGMLVKTLHAGFVPIKYIGYSTIYNPGLATRVRDQLFKCTKSKYPELIEDLVLTGNHSVLVDTITDQEREQITETLGGIYVTERKYRLPVFNDKRASTYELHGDFRIWNLALENENYYANYGIYANGLLVETTSCRYIKEISRMTLIDE